MYSSSSDLYVNDAAVNLTNQGYTCIPVDIHVIVIIVMLISMDHDRM